MKTIEERAKEYSNTNGNQSAKLMREVEYDAGRYVGYLAGYSDCQKEYEEKLRWIHVEERLPEYTEQVLMKLENEQIECGRFVGRYFITGYFVNVTHWRKIL